jgi:Bacterial protein of unknown function (DUF899)
VKDAVYLNARGVSFAVLTSGRWDEVAAYVEFMGYTQPWYSVRDVDAPVGEDMGHITCFLRDGDRVFLTYSTTGRGNEPVNGSFGLLDMTPYGRGEAWQDNPEGWPEGRGPCWYWRSDADGHVTWGPTSRPVPQWTRPARPPWRPSAGTATPTDGPQPSQGRRGVPELVFLVVAGPGFEPGSAWPAVLQTVPSQVGPVSVTCRHAWRIEAATVSYPMHVPRRRWDFADLD